MFIIRSLCILSLIFLSNCTKKEKEFEIIGKDSSSRQSKDNYVEEYGYIILDFESTAIYENMESFKNKAVENGIYKNVIWLEVEPNELIKPFQGKVVGKLVDEVSGHRGMFPKKLIDVEIYDLQGNRVY